MTTPISDFWKGMQETAARLEHERNLDGKTLAKCTAPKCVNGVTERGHDAYDGNGRYWEPAAHCRACGGRGQVEVACAPEVEAAAIKIEMAGLRKRLRELERSGG